MAAKGGIVRFKGWGRVALVAALIAGTLVGEDAVSLAEGSGSKLAEEVASHEVGDNAQVRLEDVAAFDPNGGDAIFEPGTSDEETFSYASVDSDTNRLIGLSRPSPADHAVGTFVETVPSPTPESEASPNDSNAAPDGSGEDSAAGETYEPSSNGSVVGGDAPSSASGSSTSAGVIPDPCETLQCEGGDPPLDPNCQGCDAIVEQIVALISECTQTDQCSGPGSTVVEALLYDLCKSPNLLDCEEEIARTLAGVIGELCPYGITTCADPTLNWLSGLVMGVVCPSGSLGYCIGEVNRQVNEQLAFVIGVGSGVITSVCSRSAADACIQTVQALLDAWVFQTVCGSANPFTCVANLQDSVNDTVANVCRGHLSTAETYDSAATNCVNRAYETIGLAFEAVGDAMILACESNDADVCLNVLVTRIKTAVGGICGVAPGASSSSDVSLCVDKVLYAVNVALEMAKAQMRAVCGSDVATTCANNVISELFLWLDRVNDLVANTCNQQIGATTSTSDSAVTECVERALIAVADAQRLVEQKMVEVCGSSNANACAANLVEKVNVEVNRLCASLPGDRNTTGVGECLDKAIQLVNTVLITACGSTNAVICVENLLDKVDQAVGVVCGLIPVANGGAVPSDYPGIGTCIVKTIGTVNLAMTIACRSTDANTCARNIQDDLLALADRINDTIANLCKGNTTGATGSTTDSAIANCTTLVLQMVNTSIEAAKQKMRETCGSDDPVVCATWAAHQLLLVLDKVNDLVANTCKQNVGATTSTSDSALDACVVRVLETVALVQQLVAQKMVEVCGSSDANACLANLITRIGVEINKICASLPGDHNATGINECIDKVLQIVNDGVERAKQAVRDTCGSDDPVVCVNNVMAQLFALLDKVNDLVANACSQQLGATTSTTDSAPSKCIERALATVAWGQQLIAEKMDDLCDPNNEGQTCEEFLNELCQTRTTLPECARVLVTLAEEAYTSFLDDVYVDTTARVDAEFCTDPDNCDAVLNAVAEVLYRDIREDCAVNDLACLQMYAADVSDALDAIALIACSTDGCADYIRTGIEVGLAENIRIMRTLVFEILEGLPTSPEQLEIALARDAELPDPLVKPLVDLVFPGPGSGSVDETPGGAGEGTGGEAAGGTVTGGGGKRRCAFKGTSYNKGSMDYEGPTNPDDPATTGSGGFSYTDDDLGAHSSNEAYVRSPLSPGQTEFHKDAQMTGVKFKYVKGKYGEGWVTAELHYPWHVEGELSVNTTWTIVPIGGQFSAEGIAYYSAWVGYVDLTTKDSWNILPVSRERLEKDGHRYISDDPVAPPSLTLNLEPGHTYAAWIEIFTTAEAYAMFTTRSEVKSYFATHFPTGHPPNDATRFDRMWVDKIVLETERKVRCGGGSA